MEIRPNDLLKPSKKVIMPYERSLISTEGPRITGRWNLEGLKIPYDSQFTSVIELEPNSYDKPIMYGHLGTQVTFLAIRAVYGSKKQFSTTRKCNLMSDKHLEYYYENEPLITHTFTDLLVLTGNEFHKIPQIYVSNPTEYIAQLNIMVANIGENEITAKLRENVYRGLYYSSVLSDQVMYGVETGSTQLEIYNSKDNLALSLDYNNIELIEIDENKLIIQSFSEKIELEFLSKFHALQANSRINWVLEDPTSRFLTSDYPGIDDNSPVIEFYPVPNDTYTGETITKEQLQEYIIDYIEDSRDGIISKFDTEVNIRKIGSIKNFEEISEQGKYEVSFTISDIAGNDTTKVYEVAMYRNSPIFVYRDSSSDDTIYINDTIYNSPEYDSNIVEPIDVLDYYVEYIYDYVDGEISKSAVTIDLEQLSGSTSGLTDTGITLVGDYETIFTVSNSGGLTTQKEHIFNVYTSSDYKPEIEWNSGYTGSEITVPSGLTREEFMDLTVSGLTNTDYDTTISVDDIVLDTDIVFPTSTGDYNVIYIITNYSGVENDHQDYRDKIVHVV